MLRSMTGFGSASGQVDGIEYAVELRSVNNRYFKLASKLPESWAGIEVEVEQLLRRELSRGTITCTVRMKIPDDKAACRVNVAALSSYIDQLRVLEIEGNPRLRIDLGSLLQLPGVCEPPPIEELVQATHDTLMGLVRDALARLIEMRRREGQALKQDLLGNCTVIDENLAVVAQRSPDVVKEYHARLASRVAELTHAGQINLDQEQLAREVAIFAERCDIAEEINRLKTHSQRLKSLLKDKAPGTVGREADFLSQEMLRETHTIAAKTSCLDIHQHILIIRREIEKIRQQVQNIE